MKRIAILNIVLLLLPLTFLGQEVDVFSQFNGRYDYLAFGNTLNTGENTGADPPTPCEILTTSSANFELQPGQELIAAYLYWAGSGTGDLDVTLNGTPITAERTFKDSMSNGLVYFAAFADVTNLLESIGNGIYTLANLDLTDVIAEYCGNTTNFGGWAITVIYEDPTLPLNQVTVFDGLESVSATNTNLTINLTNINVLDNEGAKIGFLAWEGDQSLAVNETLRINGNIISNPPLNPADNAFNGTNSFTGNEFLYNMDIDFYSIENNISPGDTSAVIDLTSGQDFVMINNIITVLNSQLPDATIVIDSIVGGTDCGDRTLEIDYTVFNVNCTDELPINTPIAWYANTTLIGQSETTTIIPIDGQESGTITITVPATIPADFELNVFVDDTGSGSGVVPEILEDNNQDSATIHLLEFPDLSQLQDLEVCDAVGIESFDLTEATTNIDPELFISFHLSQLDAENNDNPITDPTNFINTENPQDIFVRADNEECQIVDFFVIEVIVCPLPDATITINNNLNACRKRDLEVQFTAYNIQGTGPLPANTPIAFYIDNALVGQSQTLEIIPIGGSEDGTVFIALDESTPDTFDLLAVIDDDGTSQGVVEELDETNNDFTTQVIFDTIPPINMLPDLLECDAGFNMGTFDLTIQDPLISTDPDAIIRYYTSPDNALLGLFEIENPEAYQSSGGDQEIFVRLDTTICFAITSFWVRTENCPPFIPQGFSPNGDNVNDEFEISGLLNIYENFELKIYSREGNLIYTGGNNQGFWSGIPNTGLLYKDQLVPVGTYYYVLILNDPDMPDPLVGFVYINY